MIYRYLYNVLSLLLTNYSCNTTISLYWNPTTARIRLSGVNIIKYIKNYESHAFILESLQDEEPTVAMFR
jgi:hypothetical protein